MVVAGAVAGFIRPMNRRRLSLPKKLMNAILKFGRNAASRLLAKMRANETAVMKLYYREPFEYELSIGDIGAEWYSPETKTSTWVDDLLLCLFLWALNAWMWLT